MKGAGKRILTTLLLILLFCSVCVPAYADDYGYMEHSSYYAGTELDNPQLIFFPLLPEERCSDDYLLIYYPDYDCFFLLFNDRNDFFYYRDWSRFLSNGTMYVYQYDYHVSNTWEYYATYEPTCGPAFGGFYVVDSTVLVDNTGFASGVHHQYEAQTGYRVYWQLAIIEKAVLGFLDNLSNFCLEHEWLRYFILIGFGGEIFFFVFTLIRRIGENHEKS